MHAKLILKDKHMEITRSDTVRVSSSANTVHRETQEDFSRNVLSGFPFFSESTLAIHATVKSRRAHTSLHIAEVSIHDKAR